MENQTFLEHNKLLMATSDANFPTLLKIELNEVKNRLCIIKRACKLSATYKIHLNTDNWNSTLLTDVIFLQLALNRRPNLMQTYFFYINRHINSDEFCFTNVYEYTRWLDPGSSCLVTSVAWLQRLGVWLTFLCLQN